MYAIIESGGKQYRVQRDDIIDVELLEIEEGSPIEFKEVLLLNEGEKTHVGAPYIGKALVKGQVLEVVKGPKEVSFKYKRRKGVRRKVGHRQKYSRIKITEIIG